MTTCQTSREEDALCHTARDRVVTERLFPSNPKAIEPFLNTACNLSGIKHERTGIIYKQNSRAFPLPALGHEGSTMA